MDYIAAYEEAGYSTQYWAGDGNLETWKELLGQYRAGTLEGVGTTVSTATPTIKYTISKKATPQATHSRQA